MTNDLKTKNPVDMDPRRIETLRAIMKALRTPVTGCPWDLEQSFETIAPYTIEEAYDVADAIAKGSRSELCEELGDLLLLLVLLALLVADGVARLTGRLRRGVAGLSAGRRGLVVAAGRGRLGGITSAPRRRRIRGLCITVR